MVTRDALSLPSESEERFRCLGFTKSRHNPEVLEFQIADISVMAGPWMFGILVEARRRTARTHGQVCVRLPIDASVGRIADTLARFVRQLHPELIPQHARDIERKVEALNQAHPCVWVGRKEFKQQLSRLRDALEKRPSEFCTLSFDASAQPARIGRLRIRTEELCFMVLAEGTWLGQVTVRAESIVSVSSGRFQFDPLAISASGTRLDVDRYFMDAIWNEDL